MNKKLALGMIGIGFVVIIGSVIFMNYMLRTQGVACMTDPFGYGIGIMEADAKQVNVCSCEVQTRERGLQRIVVSGDASYLDQPNYNIGFTQPLEAKQ